MSWHPALRLRVFLVAGLVLLACAVARAADVPHLDLQLELDPVTRHLSAVARFETRQRELRLRMHRSLSIRSATLDGKAMAVPAPGGTGTHAIWELRIPGSGKVEIAYGGTVPALDRGIDHRGALRIAAPMASAEGSFLGSGTGWHPYPAELYTYRVTLTLPAAQRGLVPGDLVEEKLPSAPSQRYVAVFEMKHPAEGIDLLAGPYVIDEKSVSRGAGDPLRLRTYFTPDLRELAPGYLEDSARYVALYSEQIGAYPHAGFSIVASPLPTGFGMPTLTYLGAEVLKLPFIRATSLGHEVLHNWWGNGVFPDYATGNWSEGLTTFMADYAYKEQASPEAAREMRLAWMRDAAAVPPEARIALVRFRSRAHGADAAAGYGKSAMVFFMLRDLVGEATWSRGVKEFWERNRFKVASWRDLQQAFERAAGRSLAPFFEQWLTRSDAPRLSISRATAHADGEGYRLAVELKQQGAPYVLRVPLEVATTAGSETHVVNVERAQTRVEVATRAEPGSVKLDPDLRVWRELQARELPPIFRLWTIASAPHYFVASADANVQRLADRLARRMFESAPGGADRNAEMSGRDPLLVVGLHADVTALLQRLGLPPRPALLPADATAYAWTIPGPGPDRRPIAVVSARDAAALEALLRPLPHYGAQSYIAFQDERALMRGVWPVATPAVPVELR